MIPEWLCRLSNVGLEWFHGGFVVVVPFAFCLLVLLMGSLLRG